MALTFTKLTSGSSTADASSYATASVSPGSNKLILAVFGTSDIFGASSHDSVAGNGLTWVKIQEATPPFGRLSVWRAMGSPSAGVITLTLGSSDRDANWAVIEVSGMDTSGTDGSGAIVQVDGSDDTSSAPSFDLEALSDANNGTFGAILTMDTGSHTIDPGSGYTELSDESSDNTDRVATEYRVPGDLTVDFSLSSSENYGIIAVEIKAAAAAFLPFETQMRQLLAH